MGYRSDVAITLRKSDYLKLINKAKTHDKKTYEHLTKYVNKFYYNIDEEETEYITIRWNWIKWGYDIDEWIEENIKKYPHIFSRAGEAWEELDGENHLNADKPLYDYCEVRAVLETSGTEIKLEDILCNSEIINKKMQIS